MTRTVSKKPGIIVLRTRPAIWSVWGTYLLFSSICYLFYPGHPFSPDDLIQRKAFCGFWMAFLLWECPVKISLSDAKLTIRLHFFLYWEMPLRDIVSVRFAFIPYHWLGKHSKETPHLLIRNKHWKKMAIPEFALSNWGLVYNITAVLASFYGLRDCVEKSLWIDSSQPSAPSAKNNIPSSAQDKLRTHKRHIQTNLEKLSFTARLRFTLWMLPFLFLIPCLWMEDVQETNWIFQLYLVFCCVWIFLVPHRRICIKGRNLVWHSWMFGQRSIPINELSGARFEILPSRFFRRRSGYYLVFRDASGKEWLRIAPVFFAEPQLAFKIVYPLHVNYGIPVRYGPRAILNAEPVRTTEQPETSANTGKKWPGKTVLRAHWFAWVLPFLPFVFTFLGRWPTMEELARIPELYAFCILTLVMAARTKITLTPEHLVCRVFFRTFRISLRDISSIGFEFSKSPTFHWITACYLTVRDKKGKRRILFAPTFIPPEVLDARIIQPIRAVL